MKEQQLKVALHGFDDRSAARMSTLFRVSMREQFIAVGPDDGAVVGIVDLDGCDYGDVDALHNRFEPDSTILLSESVSKAGSFRVLKKPVKLDLLRESLAQAFAGLLGSTTLPQSLTTETATASTMRQRAACAEQENEQSKAPDAFKPDDYFVGWLARMLKEVKPDSAIYATTWKAKTLIADPHSDRLFCDISENELRNLGRVQLPKSLINQITVTHSARPGSAQLEGLKEYRLSYVIASLVMMASRGRLPEGIDPNGRYYLGQWPNFTRLPPINGGMRIASVWADEPQSPYELLRRVNAPQAQVFEFVAIVTLLGLSGEAKRAADVLVSEKTASGRPSRGVIGSLLGQIARRLSSRTSTLADSEAIG